MLTSGFLNNVVRSTTQRTYITIHAGHLTDPPTEDPPLLARRNQNQTHPSDSFLMMSVDSEGFTGYAFYCRVVFSWWSSPHNRKLATVVGCSTL